MKRQVTQRMRSPLKVLAVLVLAVSVSPCSATIGPVDSVATDNPAGSPPYNILSITVGNYTVTADQLGSGTSTTTLDPVNGAELPVLDDLELSLTYIAGETTDAFTVHMFGGRLWKNSNSDNPDFFLYEAGGNDNPNIAAILPGGVIGQTFTATSGLWGGMGAGFNGSNGQEIFGVSFAITDLMDASGAPLTNSSVIEGLAVNGRAGLDPGAWFAVMPPLTLAQDPSPADEAPDVNRDATLGWQASEFANTHDVYFGTVWEDVNAASTTNPLGVLVSQGQDGMTIDPGRLEFDQTYYWRVDEVNGAPDFTVFKGNVWSFTGEPFSIPISDITATASSSFGASGPEKTIDGSGLVDDLHNSAATDMWISGGVPATLEYAFDRAYKLHELWIWNSNQLIEAFVGFGGKDVVIEYSLDSENWSVLDGVGPLAQGPGTNGYAHNNTIDFGGAMAQHVRITINSVQGIAPQASLSEVRFLYIPTFATRPNPESGASDVAPDLTLSWGRDGREADHHDVYLGTDAGSLPLAGSVSESSFDTLASDLQLGQAYTWRVDEVNEAMDPSTWEGDLWTFTTADTIVIDDMESYRDEEFFEIWATWADGFDDPANGSLVGNGAAGTPETDTVHGGGQSLPIDYGNGGAAQSEATRTFAAPMDWTIGGAQTLVLFFSGASGNTGQLYLKVNGSKVVYDGDAKAISTPFWTQWSIDLASVGANLQAVASLTIGVEGGSGVLVVDDIALYRLAPAVPEVVFLEAEAADVLGASWKNIDDSTASGGKYIGSVDGDGNENDAAPGAEWLATYNFNVAGGVYKVLFRAQESGGNSFWVRISTATSQNVEDPDQVGTGWVRFNSLQAPNGWAWDEVHNDDPDTVVVNWTLAPGAHVLEIGKREDGTLVDAIVITDDVN